MLPITDYYEEIIDTVRNNAVTIIVAETGAGKSTQVPQYLLTEGMTLLVTQPRRIAAQALAVRVSEELGSELGELVGFRTAHERNDSAETCCLFVTDGLALVRGLLGTLSCDVLVIDEAHEQNLNIEVLLAWAKLQLKEGATFKLVIMSATLDAERLSQYYDEAPIVTVPGRTFPITEKTPGRHIVSDAIDLLRAGRNTLIFQSGKKQIETTINGLKQVLGEEAVILPLHGQLTAREQQRVFQRYRKPKCVVATNIAQTSITIPDIDAVIDSGEEKQTNVINGVEGLYTHPISKADQLQRKGRAGRVRPGIYIDHGKVQNRPEFPIPEILRTPLERTVLRLAEAGLSAMEVEFLHQPSNEKIRKAHAVLRKLGCLDESNEITTIGKQVARLPVAVIAGRMIVEATQHDVVDDIITVAAILESGEITDRENPIWRQMFCPNEKESDLLAQLAVANALARRSHTADELMEKGVKPKAYARFKKTQKLLLRATRSIREKGKSSGRRQDIIRCVIAGMSHMLFTRTGSRAYKAPLSRTKRKLDKDSVLYWQPPEQLIGLPLDLSLETATGHRQTLRLIKFATRVEPDQIPHVKINPKERRAQRESKNIDQILGVKFREKSLLVQALTHRSYLNENPNWPTGSNERLEFLGDSILGAAVASFLFQLFPGKDEGHLTALRSRIVCNAMLAEVAEETGLYQHIHLSNGEKCDVQSPARQRIVASAFEAVIGALYLDQGEKSVRELLHRTLLTEERVVRVLEEEPDAKSALQVFAQANLKVTPTYETLEEGGPEHDRWFTVGVFFDSTLIAKGEGRGKKYAEQEAANKALIKQGWK